MDPRLSAAVEASHAWYRDVFDVHALPNQDSDGLWSACAPPPRWHSAAKTLRPGVPAQAVVAAVSAFPECSVADSFGDLDLGRTGFELLIEARWLFREPTSARPARMAPGWSVVRDADALASWNTAHDTTGVLVPALLEHPRFTFLVRHAGAAAVAGAVLHEGDAVLEVSNTWSASGDVDVAAVLRCAEALHPGRPLVGYAGGAELARSIAVGFVDVGPQVVWRRAAAEEVTGRC